MKKNRIIHIEDVKEAQWNRTAYNWFREARNIRIDFECIMDAIDKCLTRKEKNVLLTHELEGEPFEHIAKRLRTSPPTACRIYKRAIKKLQEFYKKQGGL